MLKKYGLVFLCSVFLTATLSAGTKEEIIQLQSDVLALQNKIIELQKSHDASAKAARDLLNQIKDDVGASLSSINDFKKRVQSRQDETDATFNDLVRKINSLGEKLDENTQRLNILAEQVSRLQLKTIEPDSSKAGAANAPPADKTFDNAYKDFLAGNFDMSLQGFQTFMRYYGDHSDKAPEAQFYIGESYYGLKRYNEAIKTFDELYSKYPTSSVSASALYKAGLAFMDLNNRPEAITRLRTLVENFPTSNEANLARDRLKLLGADVRSPAGRPKTQQPRRKKP